PRLVMPTTDVPWARSIAEAMNRVASYSSAPIELGTAPSPTFPTNASSHALLVGEGSAELKSWDTTTPTAVGPMDLAAAVSSQRLACLVPATRGLAPNWR